MASIRCGYIAGPPDLIAALIDLQVATNFGGAGSVATEIVHATLSNGSYPQTCGRRLARARKDTAARLAGLGDRPLAHAAPEGSTCGALPEGRHAAAVAQTLMSQNVVVAPGNIFSPAQTAAG